MNNSRFVSKLSSGDVISSVGSQEAASKGILCESKQWQSRPGCYEFVVSFRFAVYITKF